MIPRVFADTAFYVGMLLPRDDLHKVAMEFATDPRLRVTTTEFVLLEVANHFSRSPGRSLISGLFRRLASSRT